MNQLNQNTRLNDFNNDFFYTIFIFKFIPRLHIARSSLCKEGKFAELDQASGVLQ